MEAMSRSWAKYIILHGLWGKGKGSPNNFILEHLLCARHFKYVISFDIQNTLSSVHPILGVKKLISLSEYIRTTLVLLRSNWCCKKRSCNVEGKTEGRQGGKERGSKKEKLRVVINHSRADRPCFLQVWVTPKPLFFPCHQAVSLAMNSEVYLVILKISNQMCPTYRGQT